MSSASEPLRAAHASRVWISEERKSSRGARERSSPWLAGLMGPVAPGAYGRSFRSIRSEPDAVKGSPSMRTVWVKLLP